MNPTTNQQPDRRTRYAAAMAVRDGDTWPTQYESDEQDYLRRADAAIALADAEQADLRSYEQRLREQHDLDVAEVRRLRDELSEYEVMNPQQCPAGKHADWLVDSERTHACPWCEIERLKSATK
ncbi:hypothetical protein [Streptomyces chartreusis]|uniref:hypothetical protein n=1 Tax=Streptomyces chartreusis TaxID=1969 RepID=UPI00123DD16A|nr:hypothetical protein [Streptomyces chartreusis]QEV66256.1 hypothetical protein CP983_05970 [Streptomyces chartreusis]GGW99009.1 hypothetical protein GCM10010321_11840 [Streptomyces chartreusis]